MFHHSSSRNHKSKGSNVKKILQVLVLLAVACWLLYQVKHSREKKTEFTGNDMIKLSKVGDEIYLGRKGDAGSENVVIIDTNTKGSDESIEMKQDEVQHDVPVLKNEDISNEMHQSHELADSQESKAEQRSYSHTNDGGDMLLFPYEEGDNSSDQNGNSNQGSRSVEESEHLNDKEKHEDVKSDLVVDDGVEVTMTDDQTTSSSADQTESSKNIGKGNEKTSGGAGSQEVSVNDEASKEIGVGSSEHNSSLSEISIDDAHVSSSQGDAAIADDQVSDAFHMNGTAESYSDSNHELKNVAANSEPSKEGEVEESHSDSNHEQKNVDANNEVSKEGEVEESHSDSNHELKNVDANNEALEEREVEEFHSDSNHELKNVDANNESSKEGEVETQLGIFSEDENKDNSSQEMKANLESGKEMKDSFSDAKAQNSSDTSGVASVESQVDRASIDSQQDKASKLENSSEVNNSEVVELQANNEVSGEAENSLTLESKSVTDILEKEIFVGDTIESRGNEEVKNDAALNDEAVTSSEVNEKINVDDLTNKVSAGEVVQAGGGNNSEAESTTGSNKDESKDEQNSHLETQQQEKATEQKDV